MGESPNAQVPPHSDDDHSEVGEETANEMAVAMAMAASSHDTDEALTHGETANLTPAAPTGYSLFSDPPNLALLRQRLFEIEDTVELSPTDFATYWPYMDNVWAKQRTGAPAKEQGVVTEWYWCRLRKTAKPKLQPKPTPEGKKTRKKRSREDVDCGMALKVIHTDGLIKSCRVVRAVEKGMRHTHDLDFLDSVKRNSAIMDTARRESVKGYLPASIFQQLWKEPDKMTAAGGKYLKVSDVRNVQYPWRQENPDVILRPHPGYSGRGVGPRQKIVGSPRIAPIADLRPDPTPVVRVQLPPNTLRYPDHAREFLEPYLPPIQRPQESTRVTPHITLTYACSLDSRLSLAPGLQTALSGPESKAMTHYLRSRHDAIVIGVRTAIADDPSLNCRLEGAGGYGGIGWSQQPRPIIIDPQARLHIRPEMKMLKAVAEGRARAPWIVVAPDARMDPVSFSTLKAHGGEYLMVHDHQSEGQGLNWEGIFGILYNEGIKSIMIEGGGIVLSELLKAQYTHLIDSVIVTIAPTFLGKAGVQVSPDSNFSGEQGRPLPSRLREVKWQPMGTEDVIMCGKLRQESQQTNGMLPGIEQFSQHLPAGGPSGEQDNAEAAQIQSSGDTSAPSRMDDDPPR
jgi:2,5-diamino-6-(ribosylamino)-4(3H)-pyrimidinone 5'-phosphate reductase